MKINNSETSLQAYAESKDTLDNQSQTVFVLLQKFPKSTANEIALLLEDSFPEHHRHNVQARLADLRDDGLVYNPDGEEGKRECRVTKRLVQLWDVVPESRRAEFKERAILKTIADLEISIARAKAKLQNLRTWRENHEQHESPSVHQQ